MRLPPSIHNRVSYLGTALAALEVLLFIFLLVLDAVRGAERAPYAGLVIYVVIPALLLAGLVLIPTGMFLEWRRVRHTGIRSVIRFPVVDLNQAAHRNAFLIFSGGSILLLFGSAFGSFQAYEATESVAFCGTLCHAAMSPEFTTYQHSPHARVRCVECHVGPGADYYLKSKLTGLHQLYAVTFDKYPRPIPAPISSLRPAQDTCEQCHWPKQFFSSKGRRLIYFLPDETNSRWEVNLLVKIGGGSRIGGQGEGIHWHMNLSNRVEYIATDERRQEIPWVRTTDTKSGQQTVYTSTEKPIAEQDVAAATMRRMDCMDCHNRPAHNYRSPAQALNLALAGDTIDPNLPFIKKTGVELLAATYDSTEAAMTGIEQGLTKFYEEKYPEVLKARREVVVGAATELQHLYRDNVFPHMKARWDAYPDNVGHLIFSGCFRCHDGQHQSADGKVLSKDCTACHTITAQGKPEAMAFTEDLKGLTFEHPEDIGGAWQEMQCADCHTGQAP